MKTATFMLSYIFTAIFTYIWRPAFIANSLQSHSTGDTGTLYVILFINYAILILIGYERGKGTNKNYLWAFPTVGAIFDIILGFIPFVPSAMNVTTLILGNKVENKKKVEK